VHNRPLSSVPVPLLRSYPFLLVNVANKRQEAKRKKAGKIIQKTAMEVASMKLAAIAAPNIGPEQ